MYYVTDGFPESLKKTRHQGFEQINCCECLAIMCMRFFSHCGSELRLERRHRELAFNPADHTFCFSPIFLEDSGAAVLTLTFRVCILVFSCGDGCPSPW
ncbi:hypothetical protein D3C80_1197270 [compost metagenome]